MEIPTTIFLEEAVGFVTNLWKYIDKLIHLEHSPVLIPMIASLFLFSTVLLFIGLRRVKVKIKQKLKRLSKFDVSAAINRRDFIEIEHIFKDDKVLGHQWREFKECVVLDCLSDEREEYHNTVAASNFFNFDDVVNTSRSWAFNIKFNFFNVVPNLLTGLGILGTFIGIISGLPDSNTTFDTSSFVVGLKKSFGTSICGLSLASVFTFFEKLKIDKAEHVVSQLAQEMDRLFKRKVEQEYLKDIHSSMEEHSKTLKTLATEIGSEVTKSITGAGIDTVEISSNIKSGIESGFVKLSENLKEINEAHRTYQEGAETILRESKDIGIAMTYLNKAIQGHSLNLNDASEKFKDSSNALENLTEKQIQQTGSMGEIAANIMAASETSQNSIDKLIETKNSFQESFSKTSHDLNDMVGSFGTLVSEYNSKTQGALSRTFEIFDSELSKSIRKINAGVGGMSDGVENLAHFLGELKRQVTIADEEGGQGSNKSEEKAHPRNESS